MANKGSFHWGDAALHAFHWCSCGRIVRAVLRKLDARLRLLNMYKPALSRVIRILGKLSLDSKLSFARITRICPFKVFSQSLANCAMRLLPSDCWPLDVNAALTKFHDRLECSFAPATTTSTRISTANFHSRNIGAELRS